MVAEKRSRRSAHRTQWAAQFAVASELCKRGYEVAFTMGNHPAVDLMVISPEAKPFTIDVKGLYRQNFWGVKAKPVKDGLFYVLALVPNDEPNRFFILTQAQVNAEVAAEMERVRQRARLKGRPDDKVEQFPGFRWLFAVPHENAWNVLPA